MRETNLTLDKKLDIKKAIEQVDQQALDMTKVTEQADQQALETEHKKEHINKLNDQEKFKSRKHLNAKQKITVIDVKVANIIVDRINAQQKENRLKLLVRKQFCKCLTEIN